VTAPSRILVRLPNWLGDVLLARPLLHRLRAGLPMARIAAVAPGALLELLAADGVIDMAFPWERERGARAAALRAIRGGSPEVALVLPPSFSSAWLAWRSGAPRRIGYAHEGRGILLTRALPRPARGDRHLSDEYLELARDLTEIAADAMPGPLRLPPAALEAGRRLRARLGLEERRFAVLAPGAIYGPAKRWPATRYAGLARRLEASGTSVVVCGTRDESEVCAEVARASGARSLAGATSLPELAGLCAAASIAVCNDSGLAHLCAALAAPTVAVFGSTSSAWTAPRGTAVRVVQRPPVCSPCFRPDCRIGTICLTALSEQQVWHACEELLAERAA
jgi:heptosyltransferase-2